VKTPQSNLADLKVSAEREIGAFIQVVTDSFGLDEARLAAEDWLQELESMDLAPELTPRDWRAVIIAAATRLAVRLSSPGGTKVSPIRSSNCSDSRRLA